MVMNDEKMEWYNDVPAEKSERVIRLKLNKQTLAQYH
jgi:hypothetical protein